MTSLFTRLDDSLISLKSFDDGDDSGSDISQCISDDIENPPEQSYPSNPDYGAKWSHFEDLDVFFKDIYEFYRDHGYCCSVLSCVLTIAQTIILVIITVIIARCVDYDALVIPIDANTTAANRISIQGFFMTPGVCIRRFGFITWSCLFIATIFILCKIVIGFNRLTRFRCIKHFYEVGLKIDNETLQYITWQEVQKGIVNAQSRLRICIQKPVLTELDIYNRILRFKNYEIALVNRDIVKPIIIVPFWGKMVYYTELFSMNLNWILFTGPWSLFKNSWSLCSDYKIQNRRIALAEKLKKRILYVGLINLLFSPILFFWQFLRTFYNYVELFRQNPSIMNKRIWSNYGQLYIRHLNELDHELEERLQRSYDIGNLYLDSFIDHRIVIISRFLRSVFGALAAVIFIVTVLSPNILLIEGTVMTFSVCGMAWKLFSGFSVVQDCPPNPKVLMEKLISRIHYASDEWLENATSRHVYQEISELLPHKLDHVIKELFSPILTPLVLIFHLRAQSLEIVDFFRNFTSEVEGVGDICSFALLDAKSNGNSTWFSPVQAQPEECTRHGKLELSAIRFHQVNPDCSLPAETLSISQNVCELVASNLISNTEQFYDVGLQLNRPGLVPSAINMDDIDTSALYIHQLHSFMKKRELSDMGRSQGFQLHL